VLLSKTVRLDLGCSESHTSHSGPIFYTYNPIRVKFFARDAQENARYQMTVSFVKTGSVQAVNLLYLGLWINIRTAHIHCPSFGKLGIRDLRKILWNNCDWWK
jgi:hypothetical protein